MADDSIPLNNDQFIQRIASLVNADLDETERLSKDILRFIFDLYEKETREVYRITGERHGASASVTISDATGILTSKRGEHVILDIGITLQVPTRGIGMGDIRPTSQVTHGLFEALAVSYDGENTERLQKHVSRYPVDFVNTPVLQTKGLSITVPGIVVTGNIPVIDIEGSVTHNRDVNIAGLLEAPKDPNEKIDLAKDISQHKSITTGVLKLTLGLMVSSYYSKFMR